LRSSCLAAVPGPAGRRLPDIGRRRLKAAPELPVECRWFDKTHIKGNVGDRSPPAHREIHIGWTAGAGIEHAPTDHWAALIEYRYSDFGRQTLSIAGRLLPDGNVTPTTRDVRLGLNYRC
jgi:opacity protein-like surface antigen